jgi:hypothetical protein
MQALSTGSLVGRMPDLHGGGVGSRPSGCMLKKVSEFCQLRFRRWWRGFETRLGISGWRPGFETGSGWLELIRRPAQMFAKNRCFRR